MNITAEACSAMFTSCSQQHPRYILRRHWELDNNVAHRLSLQVNLYLSVLYSGRTAARECHNWTVMSAHGYEEKCYRKVDVAFPQDDTLRGLLYGIYVGVSGILLKPLSGGFSLLSELCIGASGKIRAWGGGRPHGSPRHPRKAPPPILRPVQQHARCGLFSQSISQPLAAHYLHDQASFTSGVPADLLGNSRKALNSRILLKYSHALT